MAEKIKLTPVKFKTYFPSEIFATISSLVEGNYNYKLGTNFTGTAPVEISGDSLKFTSEFGYVSQKKQIQNEEGR